MKPPLVPIPGTAGGGTASTNASSMPCRRWIISAMMREAVCPFGRRSSNGLNGVKMTAALAALVNVAPLKPGIATTLPTPGTSFTSRSAFFTTASVRSSVAPSGSCTITRA